MVAVVGLLFTTGTGVMVTVLIARGTGEATDPAGDALAPGMLAAVDALACAGLLVAVGLLAAGKDAGRSAIVWLAVMALPWVVVTGLFFGLGMEVALDGRRAYDVAILGLGGVALAVLGLLAGAVLLGIRPGRRWLAHRVLVRHAATGAGTAPSPRPRFLTGLAVIVAAGALLLAVAPLSGMHADPDLAVTLAVLAVVHVVFVSAPLLVAGLGAGAGRVVLARAFSVAPLLMLPVLVVFGLFLGAASARNDGAVLPPAVSIVVSGLVTLAFLAGVALVLAGLAALADPRAQHRRAGQRPSL
jgi:hypothetical protein